MPVGLASVQAVVMGKKVYTGGGSTENREDRNQVFQYDPSRDEWSRLPPHQAIMFAMAQFMGHLITVGGVIPHGDGYTVTGKVYRFKEQSQEWEEFLKPMPNARFWPSVATTQYAIVASGGATGIKDRKAVVCDTVEVYSSETFQWHTADPLPLPCIDMTSVTTADIWYLLRGGSTDDKDLTTVLCAPLPPSFRKLSHLLTSQLATCQSGRPSLTPHC